MSRSRYILLSAISSIVLTSPLYAAEQAPDIVVTATRTEISTAQVGSSISVLTAKEIEERQYSFTIDALRSLPGITVSQNGPFGGSASVRIRGAASDQTLVLIDGVVVNDPASPGAGFNFATLDPNDIERIEVLPGPKARSTAPRQLAAWSISSPSAQLGPLPLVVLLKQVLSTR